MKVLLVEDDLYLSEATLEILKKEKMSVDHCSDGQDGYDFATSGLYDVVVLDIMLPSMSGLEILKKLREEKNPVPILLLTAKSTIDDKIDGFTLGADDYLTKPFDSKELVMRIKVLSRRSSQEYISDILEFTNLKLNINNQKLFTQKESFDLTTKEFLIMEMLLKNKESILSKNQIIEKVWGFDSEAQDNNVETYISFLRRKLETLQAHCEIVTIRNRGYVLREKQ